MRVITLDSNSRVTSTKGTNADYDQYPGLQPGEIVSDIGEFGQIMQPDGTFITPESIVVPQPYSPTNAEIAQMISDLQADLLIAGVI